LSAETFLRGCAKRRFNEFDCIGGSRRLLKFSPNSRQVAASLLDNTVKVFFVDSLKLSVMDFSLPFGGTLALAIMGSVFNNKMANVFMGSSNPQGSNTDSLNSIANLPPHIQEIIRNGGAHAVMWASVSIVPLMTLSVLAAAFLGNVWIGGKKDKRTGKKTDSMVLYEPYLKGVVAGTTKARREITKPWTKEDKERQAEELRRQLSNLDGYRAGGK
jgi:hypothetical protein